MTTSQGYTVRGTAQTLFATANDVAAFAAQGVPVKAGTIIVDASVTPNQFLGISNGTGGIVTSFNSKAARHSVHTQNTGQYGASGGGGYAVQYGYTMHHSFEVPDDASAVRFAIRNPLSASFTIPQAIVTSLPSMNAVLAEWNAATWTAVTWAGATSIAVPGTGSGFQAGAAGFVWSDWIAVPPVSRTDGGKGHVVGIRIQRPASGSYDMINNNSSTNNALFVAAFGEAFALLISQNVDGVSTPSAFTSTTVNDFNMVAAVQARSITNAVTIAAVGDSTEEGTNGVITGLGTGFTVYAAGILRAQGLPVSTTLLAHAGAPVSAYATFGISMLPYVTPDICLIQGWSPNVAPTTQSAANGNWDLITQTVAAARAAGAYPIMVTPFPWNFGSATQELYRQQVCARIRASGIPYLDNDAVYSVYNSSLGTSSWIPNASVDGIHPSEATKAVIGGVLAAFVQSYVANLTTN